MLELRVLSGLHRGAALPVEEGVLALGTAATADVVVVDPGIAELHLRIRREGDRCLLMPAEGKVFDALGNELDEAVEIATGSVWRMGEVWIGFFAESDPGMEGLPPQAKAPAAPGAAARGGAPALPTSGDDSAMPPFPADMAGTAPEAEPSQAAAPAAVPPRRKLGLAVGGVLFAIRLPATWTSLSGGNDEVDDKSRREARALVAAALAADEEPGEARGASSAGAQRAGRRRNGSRSASSVSPTDSATAEGAPSAARAGSAAGSAPSVPRLRLPADELARQLSRYLADRDLLDKVEIETSVERWEIRGSLDAEDSARLERVLRSFEQRYEPVAPISASVVPVAELLPFRVVQVAGGKAPNVVLEDGKRMYVGDTVEGYRLMSVDSKKLVFAGKRRIEVAW